MLVHTVGEFESYEDAYNSFEKLYKEMENVFEQLGLRMIKEFQDGFSCRPWKNGKWFAEFTPSSDIKYFEKLLNLSLNIGNGVCNK